MPGLAFGLGVSGFQRIGGHGRMLAGLAYAWHFGGALENFLMKHQCLIL